MAWCGLAVNVARAQIPCKYDVTILPPVNCGFYQAAGTPIAINSHGHVLGTFGSCDNGMGDSYIWTGGPTLTILPRPPGTIGWTARDFTDDGLLVGWGWTPNPSKQRGYLYNLNTNQWTILPPPHAEGWSAATGIKPDGTIICGWRSIDDGGDPQNPKTAFIYDVTTGQFADLGVIDNSSTFANRVSAAGHVTGSMGAPGLDAFVWSDGNVQVLPSVAGWGSNAGSMNSHNVIAGTSVIPLDVSPFFGGIAVIWDNGKLCELGMLPGHNSSGAGDITTNSGIVTGTSSFQSGSPSTSFTRGFAWFHGVMHNLSDYVDPTVLASVTGANAIAEDGRIVGIGMSASTDDPVAILLTPAQALGDVNSDCQVNILDLLAVINNWGQTKSPADLNNDGLVNQVDLAIVLDNWISN